MINHSHLLDEITLENTVKTRRSCHGKTTIMIVNMDFGCPKLGYEKSFKNLQKGPRMLSKHSPQHNQQEQ